MRILNLALHCRTLLQTGLMMKLGLKRAVGKKTAEKLLKGCKVYWQRSCQRAAERVLSSQDRKRERVFFLNFFSDTSIGEFSKYYCLL